MKQHYFCSFMALDATENICTIHHHLLRMLKMLCKKEVITQHGLLLVSQLAPKYPWRQRHSFGRTHTSFSLQVKLPSQRAGKKEAWSE